jgi:nucleoid DNA-binding protein
MAFERAFWANPEYPSEQLNRSDLVQLLSDQFSQLTQGDAETAVSTILETMNDATVRGQPT